MSQATKFVIDAVKMTRWLVPAGLFSFGLLLARPADAAPELLAVGFRYAHPSSAGCPSGETLRQSIVARLGYDPFTREPDAPRVVSVSIRRESAGGLVADIALSGESGTSLGRQSIKSSSGDCRVLSSAIALATRLMLEPDPSPPPAGLPAEPSPTAPTVPAPAVPVMVSRPAAEPPVAGRPRPARFVFALGPLGALGASVSPSFGAMAAAEVRWRGWSLALDVRGDFPEAEALPFGASEQIWLLAAGVVPCRRFGPIAACLLFFVGREEVRGFGLREPQALDAIYDAVGARLQAELWTWPRLGLSLSVDTVVPLARTQSYVSGQPEWSTPPFSGVLWLSAQSGLF